MLSAEQIARRKGKITSSIAAAALGLDPHTTPRQAALKARGDTEHLPPVDPKSVDRGNRLEAITLDYAAEQTGLTRIDAPYIGGRWAGDSADGLLVDAAGHAVAVLEAKTAALGVAAKYGNEGTDEVPEPCLVQAHWHLGFRPHIAICYVPVLKLGYRAVYDLYEVHRDRDFTALLFAALRDFWRTYVDPSNPIRTLPPVEAGDTAYLQSRWQQHSDGKILDGTDELRDLARAVHDARTARQTAELAEAAAKNRLRDALRDADGVRAEWGGVTYRATKPRQIVDWQAVAREMSGGVIDGALQQRHTTIRSGKRVLRVTPRTGAWDD